MKLTLISLNFGGGVRELPLDPGHLSTRLAKSSELIGRLASNDSLVAFQEFPSLLEPRHEALDLAREGLGAKVCCYLPLTTSDWHPYLRKWETRWDAGVSSLQEGLLSCSFGSLNVGSPSLDLARATGSGITLNLPTFEVRIERPADPTGWIQHRLRPWEEDEQIAWVRPTWYRGYRDTDPRAAVAQQVSFADGGPGFVFINLHLATLVDEQEDEQDLDAGGRQPSEGAELVRFMQLSVLRDFVRRVYDELRLPVALVGDFNAEPSSPELGWFIDSLGLCPTFLGPSVLQDDAPVGEVVKRWRNAESGGPSYTHTGDLVLIDNIVLTTPDESRRRGLNTSLFLDEGPDGVPAGIELSSTVSDHAPIWCRIDVRETDRS